MELLVTIAYVFLIRLIFFDFKWLKFNMFWQFVVFGIYGAAALTEVVLLGQFTPYCKECFVQAPVIQIGPEYGGVVTEVYVQPNVPIKKGEPLIEFDTLHWQAKVDEAKADLALAEQTVKQLEANVEAAQSNVAVRELDLAVAQLGTIEAAAAVTAAEAQLAFDRRLLADADALAAKHAVAQIRADQEKKAVARSEAAVEQAKAALAQAQKQADSQAAVDQAKAQLAAAQAALGAYVDGSHAQVVYARAELANADYFREVRTLRAPVDGYVTNLQVRPGFPTRLKTPVLSFVSDEERWIVFKLLQNSSQHARPGDPAEVAFTMYPGLVFAAEVESIAWANGNAQGVVGGVLPKNAQIQPTDFFYVRLVLKDNDPKYPVRFGAKATAAIYPKAAPDALIFLRKLEIRSESWLNYVFNPF